MNNQLYLIALVPDEVLRERVRKLKLEMSERFNASHALKAPAHITLQMPFRRDESFESKLTDELTRFASSQPPFNVDVDGFDSFPPRVIFLKVNHVPVKELHANLNAHLTHNLNFPHKELIDEIHPHMTIATRDLSKKMYRKAWTEFKERLFEASFPADRLHLLKHNGKHWELFREFPFKI
ncbi:2'-5' RNA ligase family protein [soil metagenome]